MKHWGPTTLADDITEEMAEEYLRLQKKLRSANAANKDLKNLKAMFKKGKKTYGLKTNPFAEIEKFAHDRSAQYTPPPEDLMRVLMVATREERVFLEAYLQTGARRGEILRWTWVDDINFEARRVRLGTRKNKSGSMEYEWVPYSTIPVYPDPERCLPPCKKPAGSAAYRLFKRNLRELDIEDADLAELPDPSEHEDMINWYDPPDADDRTEREKRFYNGTQDIDIDKS